jgi:hypothetical protein
VKVEEATPSNATDVVPLELEPLIVTRAPTCPLAGEKLVIIGGPSVGVGVEVLAGGPRQCRCPSWEVLQNTDHRPGPLCPQGCNQQHIYETPFTRRESEKPAPRLLRALLPIARPLAPADER